MTYPIFNSVVNKIEDELKNRDVKIKKFKTWNEDRINATGLEIIVELTDRSNYINTLSINFDWDRFRETVLARQLEGMDEHPFLQKENSVNTSISPVIDIEVAWRFDEDKTQPAPSQDNGNHRIEAASRWMEEVSKDVNQLLAEDDIITRWHIEVEGDEFGRYLAAIDLISYFQYTLTDMESLGEVHQFVSDRLTGLLLKSNKVIKVADQKLKNLAA